MTEVESLESKGRKHCDTWNISRPFLMSPGRLAIPLPILHIPNHTPLRVPAEILKLLHHTPTWDYMPLGDSCCDGRYWLSFRRRKWSNLGMGWPFLCQTPRYFLISLWDWITTGNLWIYFSGVGRKWDLIYLHHKQPRPPNSFYPPLMKIIITSSYRVLTTHFGQLGARI